ncbi:MAG: hypothetical protein KKD69_07410 [Euryarchaeota archaeon]|nr:hypothetical protein [Euryarchaeota archaeon]
MGLYGLFYSIFDNWLWRQPIIRQIGLVKFPNLNDTWKGYVASSFESHKTKYEASLEILQSWTLISIIIKTEKSASLTRARHLGNCWSAVDYLKLTPSTG